MVEIKDLKKVYSGREVLNIPHLRLRSGVYILRGPNGSGKSTLLRILAGITRPTRGEVKVLGGDPFKDHTVRRMIAWVGHRTGLVEDLNAYENASFFGCDPEGFRAFLERLGLDGKTALRPVRTFSRGERVKVAIAVSLSSGKSVILLDEPFPPLDVKSREALSRTLLSMRGKLIVITAHGDIPIRGEGSIKLPFQT